MKVCLCRDFDCCATREAIETHKPEHPEQVHQHIKGENPKCGRCLSLVDAMIARYKADGAAPHPMDVSQKEQQDAEKRLGERFAKEEPGNTDLPAYKRLYINRLNQI
ncbi:MAG: hypothetical protein H6867_06295 [Rhodospirillales bacterium]|nr:hypothetical protein [Rhodospirillales bacterium]MCB9995141.1 hypothetical protein [Rhodospirillales bacterium]